MTEDRVTVKFEPMGRLVGGRLQETVMAAAARENMPVRSDCGGVGKCGKCRVVLDPMENASAPTEAELDLLPSERRAEHVRLACQARVQGPLTVTIPEQFMDSDAAGGKSLAVVTYPLSPLVKRLILPGAPLPSGKEAEGDIVQWFSGRLADVYAGDFDVSDPGILRDLSIASSAGKEMTVVVHRARGLTAVIEGAAPRSLGLAVDIGTTTVAAYLCDLQTGKVVASESVANPQRRFGEDVISRISFADKAPGNTGVLQQLVVKAVSDLAGRCAARASASPCEIDEVTIVGNTTMQEIFYGAHPHHLGRAPFLPLTRHPVTVCAGDAGASLNPRTPVYVFPVVSGFVGGDTLGAVLADKPYLRREITLLVDIGTNGELVIGNRDGLWAASCATGPAFEGAHISCGMRAVSGAITQVALDADTGDISWEVKGDADQRPMGLCGSGIIDAIAVLRRAGIVLESGSFQAGMPGVVVDEGGIGREFVLVPKEETGTGMPICVTLGDIRQIQLAKAALALGIEYLARQAGKPVDRIVLTGAFGARFDWQNAFEIGMLPACVAGATVIPMDNLAGVGAISALLDGDARREIEGVHGKIRHVDLARAPGFHTQLMKHMTFPPARAGGGK